MILSRLSRAFREQNWFAVALEFVIVIAGVVIGFQITAWNNARQDRIEESAIMGRLLEEFRELEASEAAYLERATQQQRLMARWINALEDPEPVDMERLRGLVLDFYADEDPDREAALAGGPLQIIFTDPIGGERQPAVSIVFQQLVASGDLNLIRSDRVRAALTRRNAQRDQSIAALERNNSASNYPGAEAFLEPVFQAGSPDPAAALDAAMARPEFVSGLRTFAGLRTYNEVWYRAVHDETITVLAVLEDEAAE